MQMEYRHLRSLVRTGKRIHPYPVCSLVAPRQFNFRAAGESQPRPTNIGDRNGAGPKDPGVSAAAAGTSVHAASGVQPAGPSMAVADVQQRAMPTTTALPQSSNGVTAATSSSQLSESGSSLPQAPARQQEQSLRLEDAFAEFESRLEADLATVGVTLLGILGVIIFWRGVWSLLDYIFGDNPLGDLVCILVGLGIIIYIRLAGLRVGSFWPSS